MSINFKVAVAGFGGLSLCITFSLISNIKEPVFARFLNKKKFTARRERETGDFEKLRPAGVYHLTRSQTRTNTDRQLPHQLNLLIRAFSIKLLEITS